MTPGRARGLQDAQRAVAGRPDEFVLVLRHGDRKGRGDVQDEVAAGDRFRPAGVPLEIGGGEGEASSPCAPARASWPRTFSPREALRSVARTVVARREGLRGCNGRR